MTVHWKLMISALPEPAISLAFTMKLCWELWVQLSEDKTGVVAISASGVKVVHSVPFHPLTLVLKAVLGGYLVT